MPRYDYAHCDREWEAWQTIANRHTERCACGAPATLVVGKVFVQPDLTPYDDDGLGVRVESRQHRRAVMRAKSLEEVGGTGMHGARGTIYSIPGLTARAVEPSGAYARKR